MPSKSDLLAAYRATVVPFSTDGQSFHLKPLKTADMLAVQRYQKESPDGDASPMVFARSVCNEQGLRLFSDADTAAIAELVGGPVDKVAAEVLKISKLVEETPAGKAS